MCRTKLAVVKSCANLGLLPVCSGTLHVTAHAGSQPSAQHMQLSRSLLAVQGCRMPVQRGVATMVMTQAKLAAFVQCVGRAVGRFLRHALTAMLVCQGTSNHLSGHVPPQEA